MADFKRVTITEVAEKAGVSVTTVSFVLNGNYKQVSVKTIEKVQKIANELGYVPNRRAQNLQRQESGFLALVVEDLTNPFFTHLSNAIVEVLNKTDYTLAIINSEKMRAGNKQSWKVLFNATFDGGFIISKIFDGSTLNRITSNFMPFVMLDEFVEDEQTPLVSSDNYYGGSLVAKHLIENGHQRIACITGPLESPNSKQRLKGFTETLKQAEITLSEEEIFVGNYNFESGYFKMLELLETQKDTTAVFCFNDMMALGAMQAIEEKNLKVPEDISMVGYDNISHILGLDTFLTTVNQRIDQVAEAAVNMLLGIIQQKKLLEKKVFIKPELISKQSVRNLKDNA